MTFCYLFILLQVLFLGETLIKIACIPGSVVSLLMRLRVRQLNHGIRQLETEELRARWGRTRFDSFAYGLSPFYRAGMDPGIFCSYSFFCATVSEEIVKLPSELIGEKGEDDWTIDICSICLEGFTHGDSVRVLPSCGHRFHQGYA
eukprot:Gregarina_sp_Poly_1__8946@NODE_541_length_7591_cov_68_175970_g428_i0_p3_GENE_NODE_541_length_7591_cov_68_175970_g428_i0NODE_541_length_7591_cov_68_175970_g428_i0_p3_ORF_typecomplete_len146_score6_77zfRING_11/PF17123_5/3_2e09zfRING_2/PF13639_6/6_5e08zfRING_UBOX/PF13445_6/0_00015zfC3HC4_2/PF13923_6/0_0035zfC3HC4/PF00097_25/0_0071zfRING_5/PF14634_6/0_016ProkRING_1/PF14446_6/0_026_NODE_541_length_7591_cov_68_175970_g428_i045915028